MTKKIKELVENATYFTPTDDMEIVRLVALSGIEYDRQRKETAKRLDIRPSTLDKAVEEKRGKTAPVQGQGTPLILAQPELWNEPVNGTILVGELTQAIRRHVVIPEAAGLAVALWVIHSYVFDVSLITPRLTISSPEKGCGKTTLLDVLHALVARPLMTANASPAAVFRIIEQSRPTLLIDEADASLKENEELRGILNSGHRKGGSVIRTVGDNHEPRAFSTWGPVAIALIGQLPDTLQDRSVVITMRRRKSDEQIEQFRADRVANLHKLARMAARWGKDNRDLLAKADPTIPDGIFNRTADNWRPLMAIADMIGGNVPEHARKAALELVKSGDADIISFRVQLLTDIRTVFNERRVDRIPSQELVNALNDTEGHPWAEWGKGKGLIANSLARLLKPFQISPGSIRFNDGTTPKGYKREQFTDVWARYISAASPDQTATPPQGAENRDLCSVLEVQHGNRRGGSRTDSNSKKTKTCGGVADKNTPGWETEV